MWLVHQALLARRDRPGYFAGYTALLATGPAADHAVAFDRGGAITVATRLPIRLEAGGGWGDTALTLPPGAWRDALTGASYAEGEVERGNIAGCVPGRPAAARGDVMTVLEVWAPKASTVRVRRLDAAPSPDRPATTGTDTALRPEDNGWFRGEVTLSYGQDYGILLDDSEDLLPDPRSRWQPYGVHGPSRLHDPRRHDWADHAWTGRTLAGAVIYELHIGTFTPAGTFDGAIERLGHLVDLGITHVEVLPVAGVNGSWKLGL